MIDLLGIAARDAVERSLGERRLESHHNVGVRLRLVGLVAGQLEHLLQVRDVLMPDLDGCGIVLQVIIAVGKAEAALVELRDHGGGILEVLPRAEIEQRARAAAVKARDFGGELRFVFQRRECG